MDEYLNCKICGSEETATYIIANGICRDCDEPIYEITLSDNEKQIVSESELEEIIISAMEFDGFLGFTYKKINE